MSETLLAVRDLRVAYGTVEAVKGISLEVNDGEAVALLGSNGAGKSSTLRAISRMMKAKGTIEFLGKDISGAASDKAARLGLVHVPEGRRLFPSLTAEENLLVGRTALGKRTPIYSIDDIYDLFPALSGLRKRGGWALSGGEQQMVAIGRGLLAGPRVLLLDEPSLGLAPLIVDTVYKALAEVRHRVSILVVEQNASLALSLCDRAYVLAVGEMAMSGTAADFADRDALLASYLSRGSDAADPA
jgi:branched-chain amino acid transport system ATP-binding protein